MNPEGLSKVNSLLKNFKKLAGKLSLFDKKEIEPSRIKILSIGWFVKNDILKLLRFRGNIYIVAYDPCAEVVREYKSLVSPRLEVECEAVEGQSGMARLFVDPANRGATSTRRGTSDNTIEVPAVTFSEIIAKYGEFDFVYINCEGSEIAILLTTPVETLLQCAVIFVQFHKFIGLVSNTDIRNCINKLEAYFDPELIEANYPNYKFVRKGHKEKIKFQFIS